MTAMQALKSELRRVLRKQADCINEYNIVKPYRRYEYQELITQARGIKNNIEWFEKLKRS